MGTLRSAIFVKYFSGMMFTILKLKLLFLGKMLSEETWKSCTVLKKYYSR